MAVSEPKSADPRLRFVAEWAARLLKLKPEKADKFVSSDAVKTPLHDFLDKVDFDCLVLCCSSGGLTADTKFPTGFKGKAIYFVKKTPGPIAKTENLRERLAFGDLPCCVLDFLAAFVDQVLVPVVCRDSNRVEWPTAVAEDVSRQVRELRLIVENLSAIVRGAPSLAAPGKDLSPLRYLENAVASWDRLVDDLLATELPSDDNREHAGPAAELDFWKTRFQDLTRLHDQLRTEPTRKVSGILQASGSTYFPVLSRLNARVKEALAEAEDLNRYLSGLRPQLDALTAAEFSEVTVLIWPTMHLVCVAWARCVHFRRTPRLVRFLQRLANQLIEQAKVYIDSSSIFHLEIPEALEKLAKARSLFRDFHSTVLHFQGWVANYFRDPCDVQLWDLSPRFAFAETEPFVRRIGTVQELLETAGEFGKLDRVEVGNGNGRVLSARVTTVHHEFTVAYGVFQGRTADVLDHTNKDLDLEYGQFKLKVADWDLRLGAIVRLAFEDCETADAVFKLLSAFGTLLRRTSIRKECERQYPRLVRLLRDQMADAAKEHDRFVQNRLIAHRGVVYMARHAPPASATLTWAQAMRERISQPVASFRQIEHPIVSSDAAKQVFNGYRDLMDKLERLESKALTEWRATAEEKCRSGLAEAPLRRLEPFGDVRLNLDPRVTEALREAACLRLMEREDGVPEGVRSLLDNAHVLRRRAFALRVVADRYNAVKRHNAFALSVVRDRLLSADERLRVFLEGCRWTDLDEMDDSLGALSAEVADLNCRMSGASANVRAVRETLAPFETVALFERPQAKLLALDDVEERVRKRGADLCRADATIAALVQENAKLLQADTGSRQWAEYCGNLDGTVAERLAASILRSLAYLLDATDPQLVSYPLSEVTVCLTDNRIAFEPSLEADCASGLRSLFAGLVDAAFNTADHMHRVDTAKPAYQETLRSRPDLSAMKDELMARVDRASMEAVSYVSRLAPYEHLWLVDRQTYLEDFVRHAVVQCDGSNSCQLCLDRFREQVDRYEAVRRQLEGVSETAFVAGWLSVRVKPLKARLLDDVTAWVGMFKEYLMDNLVTSLKELDDFVRLAEEGMKNAPKEGDYDSLVELMRNLLAVRDRKAATDAMFEPLKRTADFLRAYDCQVPDDVHFQLQELPEKWSGVKKLAVIQKQQAAGSRAVQVTRIRSDCADFETRQQLYRDEFKSRAFYLPSCADPYEQLDRAHLELTDMEAEMEALKETTQLFEVASADFQRLRQSRRDVKLLKHLWDYVWMVRGCFLVWQKTPWMAIDIEQMDLECKKFAKDIRALDKEMRPWPVFADLETMVKNLLTALRAVGELQNPAIRERHWQQLMQATGVTFVMDERTTLADLLSLQLHNYEDEVRCIVDKAVKEMSMEKVMRDLDTTWSAMELEYERHPRTGVQLVRASEDLIAVLEDNQVQLQSIATSKYISYFVCQVCEWQTRLKTAEKCITVWLEVQRTWLHLESIFVASEDIRRQLPEDTARFDALDADFRALLSKVTGSRNVLRATGHEGMYDDLQAIRQNLSLCEKALAEYLEIKRLAFPRFYFVSSADLLDILSNGRNPQAVMRHMTKLFDSLAKLEFTPEAEAALGMHARDGEYVPFAEACDLSGQVEAWLGRVLDTMRRTIRVSLSEACAAYEDKPREKWLFDYPAQVSLCATQVWWTAEVNAAFCRLEEGYDNALKDYYKKQIQQLNTLITMLLGELSAGDRQKIMTICTVDVHARDVVGKMIAAKVDCSQAFVWQSQLRHRWDEARNDCFANVCDAQLRYLHEYLGNTPRLVITPLTDRCYITLTQSLHLIMGGAPTGPAGTGKTETTKDLGRALGIMVYVFNCSEQMDYKSCGTIYKGLAQTGAWGCFDEFNRISVEVLSVVAVQVKSIQDAIREKRRTFDFLGEDIPLDPCVGLFITMNPGYAGRSELPENLKALFRPCAMVVPDFELICEIMLVAEGFLDARKLARKFITLYTLCKELLSKQDHYDWGLRAIKSVLVVAGALKRADPGRPEDQVLMRALRDFNVPKIVAEDVPIFMGLIGDLFPSLEVPRKRNQDFEGSVRQACCDLNLQPEDGFVLKVVQLQELLDVRHSVFIIGNAGTGKTRVWNTLFRTYQNIGTKPVVHDLDPKAVTNDELFGVINRATREWKDGLLSSTMRELANSKGQGPRWVVMDGDIDPMWIESLNTVMDDNKVLTLASNERIALTPTMRLLFEITTLKCATPATVSRAGILYINSQDLGWNPYVASWIGSRQSVSERSNLTILFDKYVPTCLETMRTRFKKIAPITDMSHVQMLCHLVESLLAEDKVDANDTPKDVYEMYFAFACVWAFGAATYHDQLVDYRTEFSKWWLQEFKTVKFPGGVFDYFIDWRKREFVPWTERVARFERDPDKPLQATVVPTSETVRLQFFLTLLLEHQRPVMLVGGAGCGKTVLVNQLLAGLCEERYVITKVPFNFYTTSEMLQRVLEKPLEKKAGRLYAPPGTRRLVYFVDDMNMPEVDKYDTVQPHTIVRQHLDYSHWYDRHKLTLKEIRNCQYLSCLNPTAGSFTISSRLQRHFCVFAVSFPSQNALHTIYNSILEQHLANPANRFAASLQDVCAAVTNTALRLHQKVAQCFLPSALKFHYVFNLRDISNMFQGLLFSSADCVRSPADLLRLLVHEGRRVYQDKLVDDKDMDTFAKILNDVVKKNFEELDDAFLHEKPLVYCHFAKGIGEPKYMPMNSWEQLSRLLQGAMDSYNEINAAMNLVLFENAMEHVCRINRILESPQSSALLVGVGGSGKQSLARLAAFISGLEVAQITVKKGYGIADFMVDLASLHLKAGVKNVATMFLMTDAQVMDERFLVLVNDLLASGEIPDLFPDDEVDNIVSSLRSEVRAAGNVDTKENCWKFFMDRVRRQLKVVLCFSPVGSTLRVRSRKFPAIINCTCMDWFHEWPQEALVSVSLKFLREIEILPAPLHAPMSQAMAHSHVAVTKLSKTYLAAERRYNYTTPKSFLEQINLYRNLLRRKFAQLHAQIERLENGLRKLHDTSAQVDALKEILAGQEIILKQKNEDADKLIRVVEQETETVCAEKALAAAEAERVAQINVQVLQKQRECEADLVKAEPALFAAQEALDTLNKNNLTELKSFGSPPPAVSNVTAAVMVLTSGGKIPRDRSWKAAKIMMAKVDQFLDDLVKFDKENVHPEVLKAIRPYLDNPEFQPDLVRSKSAAAAGLCSWVINIIRFYEVFCDVEPKRMALKAANAELAAAQENLATIATKIESLEAALAKLTEAFREASADKQRCQEEAEKTYATIALANRLVGGLASENVRWAQAVADYRQQEHTLPGDVFLISAFISYAGGFGKLYRNELVDKKWLPFLRSQDCPIPLTDGLDPLSLLTDDAQVAVWNNEGLPNDRVSTENATILSFSERWPLIIDPQLQGIKWIKKKYRDSLLIVQLGQRGYLDVIEKAVQQGGTVLIENIGENIDPVLDPLLGRNLIRKGTAIKVGDKEVEYNPAFRLILHTKLANPHYKPELQAQTTLINFTVTQDGLEDQLLAEVVNKERPELEMLKADLTKQQNDYKIALKELEDSLLQRLSSAQGDFLGDALLVDNLENTKKTALETARKVNEAKKTEAQLNTARNLYRPAAARASLLYFVLGELANINPLYVFSLKAFKVVFNKAIERAEPDEDVAVRVGSLIDCVTFSVFLYTSRGLFERDKLTFTLHMTLQILMSTGEVNGPEVDFLLRYPAQPNVASTVDFLTDHCWGGIKTLSSLDEFRNLDRDMEANSKRWKKLLEAECPEKEKMPGEWKNRSSLQRLCILRALRPDRMTCAVSEFVAEKLGSKYTKGQVLDFATSFEESGPATPVFFILSPGVDPLQEVEALGRQRGYTSDKRNLHVVSLGQGQEAVAEGALATAIDQGHWVILQNVHLVRTWLPKLEQILQVAQERSHPDLRVLMSAEPPSSADSNVIPPGLLESAIKITNEPPAGIKANLHKALDNFTQEWLEMCTKEAEFKSVLFSMCYFHAVVTQRRKFGAQGWNTVYPFSTGDLTISAHVLLNYLETGSRVPWEDLRYLFGEIMYGGHITDNFDRRLCRAYFEEYLRPEQLEGELLLAPDFPSPPSMDYTGYHQYVEDALPQESPYLYGLHPNAEIGFLTQRADSLFRTVLELQPRLAAGSGGVTVTRDEKVKQVLDEMWEKLPDEFNVPDMGARVEEKTPYIVVALQECERMNVLLREMRRALRELDLGLKGELTITADMEVLSSAMYLDQVPASWTQLAYPSLLPLGCWYADLLLRYKELEAWTADFQLPTVVWLSGFFNPQSFLTAIMQLTARRNEMPLDKMCLQVEVTKKTREEMTTAPREGAYVHGLYLEGARWDAQSGTMVEPRTEELHSAMPVLFVRAVHVDKQESRNVYECPVYKTRTRANTYVWTFKLKTKERPTKWVLAGVALLLQI